MEVADGGSGGVPVTPPATGTRRRTVNAVLVLVLAVLGSLTMVGGVLTWQTAQERSERGEQAERYAAALDAATAMVEAFVNVDYRDAEESFAEVAALATGDFRDQYDTSLGSVSGVLADNESVMTGEVVWSGVSSLGQDQAQVLVATTGTVANTQTEGRAVARNFRLRLDLEWVDGAWLTSDLVFVG